MAKKDTLSKRQILRQQREKRQRQQRIMMIVGIAVVAVVLAVILIIPQIQRIQAANAPVGNITTITPKDHPQAQGTAMGDPNAPVKIEVFEDFQCPACRDYTENIEPQIVQNDIATGKVYYVFRNYPFIDTNASTKESHQAANAAMCAADQNRFWDYHDMLFANWNGENNGSFTDNRLKAFAENLGLDMNKFNTCFSQNTHKAEIQADINAATQYGVTGTPSVFVNGKEVAPGYIPTYDQIQQAIAAAQGQ